MRWTKEGIEYEADPRQGEKLLVDLELSGEGVKSAATPGVKPLAEQLARDQDLGEELHTKYRAAAARANYLAADRPDCQYGAKEVCRWMSKPSDLSQNALKRLGRFLVGRPRLVFQFKYQEAGRLEAYSDTDWAGCAKTRKSTPGSCLMIGSHLIKS